MLLSCAAPALADIVGCPKADVPSAARKGLEKVAKRENAGPLDLSTLYYCTDHGMARATVDSIPVAQPDGSEALSTLVCATEADRPRDWLCHVDRYQSVRVAPADGQAEVRIEVGERVSFDSTREYALRAFALLNEPGTVDACARPELPQTTESLRGILARLYGPYRLVIAREGFALVRAEIQVRFRAANAFNPRAQVQCWEAHTLEE